MKQLLLFLLLLFTLNSTAQDPQLDDNVWYLDNLIISGENNIPPSNGEVPSIPLEFFTVNDFYTYMCNGLYGELVFDDILSSFTFTGISQTLIKCDFPENADYENLYFWDFYFTNEATPFTYNIVEHSDTSKTLTITAANGDQAIYGSALLQTNSYKLTEIKVYPNPVINEVFFENQTAYNEIQVEVFDIMGKLKISEKIDANNITEFDVKHLESGAYFFVFETKEGRRTTKKIIKQ